MELTEDGIIKVFSGDDDYVTLYYSDSRSMSSESYFFTVKPSNSVTTDDTDALLKKEPTDVVYIESATKVVIPVNDSSIRIAYGTYKYDIQRKGATGNIRTLLSGVYKVVNDTTKRIS